MAMVLTIYQKEVCDMPPVINRQTCITCGVCADICCMDVFRKTEDEKPIVEVRYPDECWHCRACVMDCPVGAITMRYPLSHMMLHVKIPNTEGEN